jgi:glycosyltransferase involved in cell wall biosynthesis
LKTLHLDTGREMGGGQWQVLRLVRGLVARGDQPFLMARGELLARARVEQLPVEPFRWFGWPTADLVHAHDARAHAAASVFRSRPLLVARRVAYPIKTGFASRLKYRRADGFIAVSRFVASILSKAGVPAEKIDVVYDGVPLLPLTTRRERIIAPANKAVNGFVRSFDLERDLATASVFVYVSECEGLGSALLLAMSAGVPVVASNVGGIPEIVTNGEDGILVDNSVVNRKAAIDAAVQKILKNPGLYGQRARQKIVERFQEGRMVEDTLNVYRKLLQNV